MPPVVSAAAVMAASSTHTTAVLRPRVCSRRGLVPFCFMFPNILVDMA